MGVRVPPPASLSPDQLIGGEPWCYGPASTRRYPRMIHMHRWDDISLKWMTDDRLNAVMTALLGRDTYEGVANYSMNQVLMRSVNTSLVVILPILSLLLFGGHGAGRMSWP